MMVRRVTTTCNKAIVLLLLSHCAISRRTREDGIYVAEEKKAISHLKPLVLMFIRARREEMRFCRIWQAGASFRRWWPPHIDRLWVSLTPRLPSRRLFRRARCGGRSDLRGTVPSRYAGTRLSLSTPRCNSEMRKGENSILRGERGSFRLSNYI